MNATTPSSKNDDPSTNSKNQEASKDVDKPDEEPEVTRFSPEEEAELLAESNAHKAEANTLFNSASYMDALARYADAIAACPNYLSFELAVLHSNVSACHLKLEDWKEAIASASKSVEKLDSITREISAQEEQAEKDTAEAKARQDEEHGAVEEEIVSAGAASAGPALSTTTEDDEAAATRAKRRTDVARIRYKALMRRARARSEAGGWTNLAGAEEDYKTLSGMDNVGPGDRKIVAAQLRTLPSRVKAAQEKETAEMWDKLKEFGNGILKPFGLSTNNFQMQQDPKTGGYSMNFKQ